MNHLTKGLVAFAFLVAHGSAALAGTSIVAFGGSSTYGQGVSRGEAFPAKLETALRQRGIAASVTNAGVSGRTSTQGLAVVDSEVPAGTALAIIELGVNDRYAGINPATTQANVSAIVQHIRSRGAKVLVIDYRGSNGSLASVAKAAGAAYMAGFNFKDADSPEYRVAGDPQQAARGYGHFNGAGYDKIVAVMLPQVMKLVH